MITRFTLKLILFLIIGVPAYAQIKICAHRTWPLKYEEALKQAVAHWEEQLVYVGGCSGPGAVPVSWKKVWKRPANELGVTLIHANGFKQVNVNATYKFSTHIDLKSDEFHLQSLLAHEFGHVLGHKHDEKNRLMKPVIEPGEIQMFNIKDPNLRQYMKPMQPDKIYPWIRK